MNQRIALLVDVMSGNEEDFTASLGYYVEDVRLDLAGLDIVGFGEMIERVTSDLPNLAVVTTTLRGVRSIESVVATVSLLADLRLTSRSRSPYRT